MNEFFILIGMAGLIISFVSTCVYDLHKREELRNEIFELRHENESLKIESKDLYEEIIRRDRLRKITRGDKK